MRELDKLILKTDSEYLSFNVREPMVGDSYVVQSITGLGPVTTNVNMASLATHGSYFGGVRRESREIVVTISLHPNWEDGESPISLRTRLYNLLNTSQASAVDVVLFLTDLTQMTTKGYISTFDTNMFSSRNIIQIVLKCSSAVFTNTYEINLDLGTAVTHQEDTLRYRMADSFDNGDGADSGVLLTYESSQSLKEFVCGFVSEDLSGDPAGFLDTPRGDHLHFLNLPESVNRFIIDTRPGSRSAIGETGTKNYNLLPYLTSKSDWLALRSERVRFFAGSKIRNGSDGSDYFVKGSVQFHKTYWGI